MEIKDMPLPMLKEEVKKLRGELDEMVEETALMLSLNMPNRGEILQISKLNKTASEIELQVAGESAFYKAGDNLWILTRLMEDGALDVFACTLADKLMLEALLSDPATQVKAQDEWAKRKKDAGVL